MDRKGRTAIKVTPASMSVGPQSQPYFYETNEHDLEKSLYLDPAVCSIFQNGEHHVMNRFDSI